MVTVLGEELEQSWTYKYLLQLLRQLPKDRELSIGYSIKLAVKYPLMFYMLKRFRQHIRRIFLGDKVRVYVGVYVCASSAYSWICGIRCDDTSGARLTIFPHSPHGSSSGTAVRR